MIILVNFLEITQNLLTDMKVSPFHSTEPNIEVYHNSNRCTEGNNIESRNWAAGTGGKRLCDHCHRLES